MLRLRQLRGGRTCLLCQTPIPGSRRSHKLGPPQVRVANTEFQTLDLEKALVAVHISQAALHPQSPDKRVDFARM